ncbi:hypothetical protein [Mycobacterium sp. SMC-19]|uniref:hypothetical protein n=1 Tax=Mycobacterium sp. SMC-19 TaxID=3381630 RepID=UPI00387693CD
MDERAERLAAVAAAAAAEDAQAAAMESAAAALEEQAQQALLGALECITAVEPGDFHGMTAAVANLRAVAKEWGHAS